jgi:nitrogen fixation/metabolism regulation signal transduction histidine kinase
MAQSANDLLSFPEEASALRTGPRVFRRRRSKRLRYQTRILLLAAAVGMPGTVTAIALLFAGDYSLRLQVTLILFAVGGWMALAGVLFSRVVRPLQTAANMLSAMREGDFSMQAGFIDVEDALGQVMFEINSISSVMRRERLGAIEAISLLNKVIEEIDLGLFTFSQDDRQLKLVNKAAERLLGKPAAAAIGRTADDLGVAALLDADVARPLESFPGVHEGRFGLRRAVFREGGMPHVLVLVADISRALREEERQAWKRLIRVIGHELNNSLAPIHSLSSTLSTIINREQLPEDWREDMRDGLDVIRSRATHLSRFMEDYSRIARLPPPRKEPVSVPDLARRIVALEHHVRVRIADGGACTVPADVTQLEQVLINVIKNAAEAVAETGGGVTLGWEQRAKSVAIWIEDEGAGIANPANLFTPFYSTKKGGSGIGLVLSRQIVDAHEGSLLVENRSDRTGVRATIVLPR